MGGQQTIISDASSLKSMMLLKSVILVCAVAGYRNVPFIHTSQLKKKKKKLVLSCEIYSQ